MNDDDDNDDDDGDDDDDEEEEDDDDDDCELKTKGYVLLSVFLLNLILTLTFNWTLTQISTLTYNLTLTQIDFADKGSIIKTLFYGLFLSRLGTGTGAALHGCTMCSAAYQLSLADSVLMLMIPGLTPSLGNKMLVSESPMGKLF